MARLMYWGNLSLREGCWHVQKLFRTTKVRDQKLFCVAKVRANVGVVRHPIAVVFMNDPVWDLLTVPSGIESRNGHSCALHKGVERCHSAGALS